MVTSMPRRISQQVARFTWLLLEPKVYILAFHRTPFAEDSKELKNPFLRGHRTTGQDEDRESCKRLDTLIALKER